MISTARIPVCKSVLTSKRAPRVKAAEAPYGEAGSIRLSWINFSCALSFPSLFLRRKSGAHKKNFFFFGKKIWASILRETIKLFLHLHAREGKKVPEVSALQRYSSKAFCIYPPNFSHPTWGVGIANQNRVKCILLRRMYEHAVDLKQQAALMIIQGWYFDLPNF